jgi:UDP-glucose 6-dehydrogenase
MVEAYNKQVGGNLICAEEVPDDQTDKYGIITPGAQRRADEVKGLVEKPAPGTAPSNLSVIGRYADAVFIAVGTPSRRGDGHADLSYVYAAAREIAENLTRPSVIVTKSTVPVGTGDEVERIIAEVAPDSGAKVVSNPEFLREGAAIEDFKRPDRVVIGTEDERAAR